MQITQCMICRLRIAKYSCNMCGISICENCYDKRMGVCVHCKQGKRA